MHCNAVVLYGALHKLQLHLAEVEVALADAAESAFDQYELQLAVHFKVSQQQKISGELNSDFIQQQPSFYFDSIVLNSATLSCYPP